MSQPSIRFEIREPFGEIILNKPDKRNALSVDMWAAIPELIERAVAAETVKIVLIHGGDAGAFAAGADISEFPTIYSTPESAAAAGETIEAALGAVETCPKPVIAAIEGACVGGGTSLAMAADLRVAGETARFGITPAKLGIVYPVGDTRRLVAAMGAARAKDVLLTGRIFDAAEAATLGLLNRTVPAGSALAGARELGEAIAANSQWSARAIKQMVAGVTAGWDETSAEAQALFLAGFASEDFKEGYTAFLEKRPARFTFK
ncbi:enoyl-CoA hydratase/isomerase family protein [Hyphomonas johnsonii]|uniref:Enoyl-CoA hydratase/isomerase n=1 Tax=Hyphomonas johnsonii MHS-2 TaxID=1280950 RepID=A0A059FHF2_9PROT|nr:enoyl-CoA hydratase-related protein [Hyphomonas johnsonii]KCZ90054.1 enoyl-CoA hydratase/isomerase [Hyphomonas johnsonii MHS-2]